MDLAYYLGIIAGFFLIAGYVPYIYEVLKGTDVPNQASWLIWCLSTVTILFGVHETGTTEAIWVPVADAIGCSVIFILSLKFGVRNWSKTDKVSLSVCLLSLIVWWLSGNILVALIANLLIYISGYIPTIKKSTKNPEQESFIAWTFFLVGVLLNLVTVIIGSDTGFAVWLYPIVLVATVGTLYFFLLQGKFASKK